jgi:PAS domain S-box-containing protein
MPRFSDIPIKQKLMVIIMATSGAALIVSGLGILFADSFLFRGYLERDLSALSQIVADNSTAALAFDDAKAAREILGALRARTHMLSACIYRPDRTVLASYSRGGSATACEPPAAEFEIEPRVSSLSVSRPIMLQRRRLGTLTLLYDLDEISNRSRLFGGTVLGVLLASSIVAFLLSSRLRALIATPVSQLALASLSVSSTQDYSIRVPKTSEDELGVLIDAFNAMLAGIQSRDQELQTALTEREDALGQAQSARDSLKTTLASIGDAVISTDLLGKIVFSNAPAQALVRLREQDMQGKHLDEVFCIINEFTRAKVASPLATVLLQGGLASGMTDHPTLIAGDGTEVPIAASAAPIRDERGAFRGAVIVFRDDTARRRAEETRNLLASIVESSDDAIVGHDLNSNFTSWNKGAERIFGYSAEEALGRSSAFIAAPNSPDEMPELLERIRHGERIEQYHALRCTKKGKVINVSLTVSPLYDAVGRIIGASKVARDITGQVEASNRLAALNADLRRSNESLARSNDDLERFAFVASHDLQEPLRMITAYSQLLVRSYSGSLDPNAATFVDNIVGGTKRMQELLADLLAYTEIGAATDQPIDTVDLNGILEKVTQNLKVTIQENGAAVAWDSLPIIRAHPAHFVSLFQNLIGNAIKYRSAEPPRIHVSVQENGGQLRFSVTDNGIGIAPEYHDKIFVPFKRLHDRKIPGTGIGLAICQRVVERYGGKIWVDSQVGRGSTFFFTLPGTASAAKL